MADIIIGIDFGTSYTYIYSANANGPEIKNHNEIAPSLYGDFNRVSSLSVAKEKGIKTIIGIDDNGEFIVGWEVERAICNGVALKNEDSYGEGACLSDGRNVERNIKEKLRNMAKELSGLSEEQANQADRFRSYRDRKDLRFGHLFYYNNGETKYLLATEMAKELFGKTFKTAIEDGNYKGDHFHNVSKIVVGMPAIEGVGETYRDIIDNDVIGPLKREGLFNKDIQVVVTEEPILACRACMQEVDLRDSKNILVIDIGGGTADYAILSNLSGDLKPVAAVGGGEEPAGKDIDLALKQILQDELKKPISDSDMDLIMNAKESLFKSRKNLIKDYTSRYLRSIKYEGRRDLTDVEEEQIFKDWLKFGRRKLLNLGNNNKCYVVYNNDAVKANQIPYFHELEKKSLLETNYVIFEDKLMHTVNEKFIDGDNGIKSYTDRILNGHDFDTVIFVGGTSNIIELRNSACAALGLEASEDGFYVNGKTYKIRGSEKSVKILFTSEAHGEVNCSNAVAYGALVQGLFKKNITWEHDFRLRFPGDDIEYAPILWSQQIKENNCGEKKAKFAIYGFKDEGKEFNLKNPGKNFKFQFWIEKVDARDPHGQPLERYPKRGYFSISLDEGQIDEDVDVLFFMNRVGRWNKYAENYNIEAEVFNREIEKNNGDLRNIKPLKKLKPEQEINSEDHLRLYVFIDDQRYINNRKDNLINLRYSFIDEQGGLHTLNLSNTRGTMQYLKCYDFSSSKYTWSSPLNKEGFEKYD